MTIRVAMIADLPESPDEIDGGVQAVTNCLVSGLTRIGEVDLHLLTFRSGIDDVTTIERSGFVQHLLPFSPLGTITLYRRDQALVDACLASIKPDIVHSQGAGHDGVLAIRSEYPSVLTIHGIIRQEARYLPGFRRRMRARLESRISEYHCIRRATHTILISSYVAEYFGDSLRGASYVIPNPVDPRFFDVPRREQPGRILFAGRLYRLKGVRELLEAASRIEDRENLRIVLAGANLDSDYVSEVEADIVRLKLKGKVEISGIMQMEQLLAELSRCSCLVLPSYQETAPMVVQEAMASGVPVIASNVGGIPEQVTEGKTGFLVDAGDIEGLADRLSTLLSDEGLRIRFGTAGRERARDRYRVETVAGRTMNVYRDMLQ